MVKFQIDDKHYQTPEGWHQVTFGKFLLSLTKLDPFRPMALIKFLEEHSEAVRDLIATALKTNKVANFEALRGKDKAQLSDAANKAFNERWVAIPPKEKDKCHKFFALTLSFWCNIPKSEIMEAMKLDDLTAAFWAIEYELNPDNAQVDDNWIGFELNGIEYVPPIKHMEKSTVVEFAESAQFQENLREVENGNWLAMLDVMVVLCRPKGEVYDYVKAKHQRRKELFKGVSMDKVINTAFFLLKLNRTLSNNLAIYTLKGEVEILKQKHLVNVTDGLT